MSVAHRVSWLTTYSLIYTYIYIIESFLPLVQPLIVTQKYTNVPWVRAREEKKSERTQQSSSTLENLQAICVFFYRFIHQRGISIHYKNRNIVDIEALGVD